MNPGTEEKETAYLDEAVEAAAAVIVVQTRGFGDYRSLDVARAAIEAADPFFARHYEQKGAEGERAVVLAALDDWLREDDSYEALHALHAIHESLKANPQLVPERDVPLRLLKALRDAVAAFGTALSEKETDQPSGEDD